jgi:hypothetical protein
MSDLPCRLVFQRHGTITDFHLLIQGYNFANMITPPPNPSGDRCGQNNHSTTRLWSDVVASEPSVLADTPRRKSMESVVRKYILSCCLCQFVCIGLASSGLYADTEPASTHAPVLHQTTPTDESLSQPLNGSYGGHEIWKGNKSGRLAAAPIPIYFAMTRNYP